MNFGKALLKGLKNFKNRLVNAVKSVGKFLKKVAKEIGKQIKALAKDLANGLKAIVNSVKGLVEGVFNFFRYSIKGIFEAGLAILKGDFTGALKVLFDNAVRAIGANPASLEKLLSAVMRSNRCSTPYPLCQNPSEGCWRCIQELWRQYHRAPQERCPKLAFWRTRLGRNQNAIQV